MSGNTSTRNVNIDLGERSYPIHIGSELITDARFLGSHVEGQQVLLVSNDTVAPLYLEQVHRSLGNRLIHSVVLPDGEAHKNMEVLQQIFDGLLEAGFDRGCTVVALGGGVVGDMAGFAAASYQRGVKFVQIPTTLLAQVDSSVGGKTGVNHTLGKNMIGAFHQPISVIADISTLRTLPDEELSAGLAEVIKYGFIYDAVFFDWLENNIVALRARDADALIHAIERSCEIKAEVVACDEREQGIRAILNLGHTFGHAIEAAQGYGSWLHGQAVAAGTVMALDLSQRCGYLSQAQVERGRTLLLAAGLPVTPPADMRPETFLEYMQRDKKVIDGQLRLVLLEDIGQAIVTQDFDPQLLHQTLASFCGDAA